MSGAWLREEQADLAVDKILGAASSAFADLGVSRTRMGHIAQYAGCSRGTLYRYFKTRRELDLAYFNRSARLLSAHLKSELAGTTDPRKRMVEGILRAVQEVRESPGMSAWFAPDASGRTARLSHDSRVINTLSIAFVEHVLGQDKPDPASEQQGRWLVRVVVSLLTMPGESAEEERMLVERFVAPGLLDDAKV
jgi:AcrR family transcriptional regulator